MRTAFTLLLLLALPLAAAPVPKALKRANDAERIVGRWVCESASRGETEYTTSHKNDVWVFAPAAEKSAQVTQTGHRYSLDYQFVDGGDGPRQMDLSLNGIPYKGVYHMGDDTLAIAFRESTRPAALDRHHAVFVFTFRREATK